MRAFLSGLCFLSALSSATASEPAPRETLCLSSGETAEAVTARQVVAPGRAIVVARRSVPGASVLRAALCRSGDGLVYRITMLRDDGKIMRVTIDAPGGRVKGVR